MLRCACGCGEPPDRGSRYVLEHRKFMTVVNSRFRACRRFAFSHGIEFAITERDIADLIASRWHEMDGVAIRRVDRRRGFVRGNLRLGRGRRRGPPSPALVRKRLAQFLRRRELAQDLSLVELEGVLRAQQGRCWYSGRALRTDLGTRDRDALAIVRIDRARGYTADNIRLVVRAVAVAFAWGGAALVALARDVVTVADERARRKAARRASPPSA